VLNYDSLPRKAYPNEGLTVTCPLSVYFETLNPAFAITFLRKGLNSTPPWNPPVTGCPSPDF
jgi:hypothetical protein